MKAVRQLPSSGHFRLEQLADGVYAAIHIDGGWAISNAGIVDLGDRTLVYDALLAPQAGADLRAAAETLLGRPVDMVIDSHWHYDHIWGNQAFSPDTDIISTAETRRLIIATKGHGAYDSFLADCEANLAASRQAFDAAQDIGQRRQLALWVDYHRSVAETKPIIQIRPPNVTFVERMALHGTARSAELIDFPGAHTESDAVLFLPKERIVFMSDVLFVDYHPYLGGGDPERFLQALDAVASLAPEVVVPGHGPVGTVESLIGMKQYVTTLDGLARKMVEDGQTEDMIPTLPIPKPYDDWLFASFFPVNMQFLYRRQQSRQSGA